MTKRWFEETQVGRVHQNGQLDRHDLIFAEAGVARDLRAFLLACDQSDLGRGGVGVITMRIDSTPIVGSSRSYSLVGWLQPGDLGLAMRKPSRRVILEVGAIRGAESALRKPVLAGTSLHYGLRSSPRLCNPGEEVPCEPVAGSQKAQSQGAGGP
jgi:hypothetical protein